jgi:hypothetical protein
MYFALYDIEKRCIRLGTESYFIDKERKTSTITPKIKKIFSRVALFYNIESYAILSGESIESVENKAQNVLISENYIFFSERV